MVTLDSSSAGTFCFKMKIEKKKEKKLLLLLLQNE